MSLLLQVQNLAYKYPEQLEVLFQNVDFTLYAGDTVALLGFNGAGKSTLLELILGELTPDEGEIIRSGTVQIVRQEDRLEAGSNVQDALLALNPELSKLYGEIARLEADMSDPLRYADAVAEFAERGGYDLLQTIEVGVSALGFAPEILAREVASLSGGERRLLKLLSVFVQDADVLILDEPTNYLDERATTYLVKRLQDSAGACLLVSHDRWFLDQVAARVLELEHGQVSEYSGNYSTFRATKDTLFRQKARQKDKLETEINKLQAVERSYKIWGAQKEKEKSGAADKGFVGARAARLNKRGIQAKERLNARIDDLKETIPWTDKQYSVSFANVSVTTGTCLSVRELSYAYGSKKVLTGVSFTLAGGERTALTGENGSGKSTVIKLLLGELTPATGELTWSKGLHLGYLPQLWQMPPGVYTPADWFSDDEAQEARLRLGALRVKGDAFTQPFDGLSEGQKRKVRLVRLMLDKPNVLILDEPTTHLDYKTVEMLELALEDYAGTLILVSHDKYLRERLCDREVALTGTARALDPR